MQPGPKRSTCELSENCSFFWNNRNYPEVVERKLIERYCLNQENEGTCARIRILLETGDFPESEVSPEGDAIRDKRAEAPEKPAFSPISRTPFHR
jgi:hypothetical protein